jgi:hypothetical protein
MVGLVPAGASVASMMAGASASASRLVRLEERISYVYIQRVTKTGEFTKWGATSIGLLRYSATARRFLGVEVVAIGSRRDMWALEYELTTRFPGILNLESHAGRFAAVPFPVTPQAHKILVGEGFIGP